MPKNTKKFDEKPIDDYEMELMKSIEKDEFVSTIKSNKDLMKLQSEMAEAARYTMKQKSSKNISIRVKEGDLDQIKAKAVDKGMPYQTLINALLHQYATGRIRVML